MSTRMTRHSRCANKPAVARPTPCAAPVIRIVLIGVVMLGVVMLGQVSTAYQGRSERRGPRIQPICQRRAGSRPRLLPPAATACLEEIPRQCTHSGIADA